MNSSVQSLLSAHTSFTSALMKHDVDGVQNMLSDTCIFTGLRDHSTPITKQEMLSNLKTGKLTYRNINLKNPQVQITGDTGVLTGESHRQGKYQGSTFVIKTLITAVWQLTDEEWKLVAAHIGLDKAMRDVH